MRTQLSNKHTPIDLITNAIMFAAILLKVVGLSESWGDPQQISAVGFLLSFLGGGIGLWILTTREMKDTTGLLLVLNVCISIISRA